MRSLREFLLQLSLVAAMPIPTAAGVNEAGEREAASSHRDDKASAVSNAVSSNTPTAPSEENVPLRKSSSDKLRLDFHHAQPGAVLDYFSDEGGLIIDQQTDLRGAIEVYSKDPVTRDEAVEILSSALKKNGYCLNRHGRILTILRLDQSKDADLEVLTDSKFESLDRSDEVVTQIIPVRYANANQLVNNLAVLLPATATVAVNESANSLILVASKRDIRRMLKIIQALDSSIASVFSIKVFVLRYADAKALATVVQQLFASQSATESNGSVNSAPQMFGPPGDGFGPPGFPGQTQGAAASKGDNRASALAKVTAVADESSNSLIVSANSNVLASVGAIVRQLDRPVAAATELRVFYLRNADPTELAQQLAELFADTTKAGSEPAQMPVFFGGDPPGGPGGPFGGGPPGAAALDNSTGSSRAKNQVLAVGDARTSALLVSASSMLMPSIARLIEQLDASSARKELVQVYELRNAEPNDLSQILRDLFNRNTSMRASNTKNASAETDTLAQRATQQQTSTSSTAMPNSGTPRAGSSPGF